MERTTHQSESRYTQKCEETIAWFGFKEDTPSCKGTNGGTQEDDNGDYVLVVVQEHPQRAATVPADLTPRTTKHPFRTHVAPYLASLPSFASYLVRGHRQGSNCRPGPTRTGIPTDRGSAGGADGRVRPRLGNWRAP